ncbi:hypothetical protein [Pseudogemmobacter bohemicus]|uniref:hypothetical protein n=1 Tax=Pseudogemmobacter bohemicus TaxID=2250708 RepID=UPI001300552F|nr:hypothetical protein [Pseudogemmobacter bohemicus]
MADPFTVMSGVGSLLGGVAGLFGSRRKNPSPRDNMMSQAQGARDAAEAYGFNPLTMLQYGNPGGTGLANNGPPLASFDMLASGFREIGDVVSGDADRRRAQEDAKLDLAKLEIERLQAGRSADALGGVSPLGNRPSTVGISGGTFQSPRVVSNPDRTSVQVASADIKPDIGWSDAEEIEKRYGDAVSWVYGAGVAAADGYNSLKSIAGQAVPLAGANKPDNSPSESVSESDEMRDMSMRLWGATPDGFTADNRPFWRTPQGIAFTPPNARKGQ